MMLERLTFAAASPGAVLDDLLASRFLSKRWARRVRLQRELPACLSLCVRNLSGEVEWRAYLDDERLMFAAARMHCAPLRGDTAKAIDVCFMDENASIYSAGVWECDPQNGWWLDAVLDLSYDCESGWCVEGLIDPHRGLDRRRLQSQR
jgi:hypothetical protein